MHEVIEATPEGGFRLFLRFADGASGTLDLANRIRFQGIFAPLTDEAMFARAEVNPELGTAAWPGGADLCPDVLHAWLMGSAPPGG